METINKEELNLFKLELLKRQIYGYLNPSENEIEIMDFVSDTLNETNNLKKLELMDKDTAIEQGILSLVVFNKKYINKVKKIIFMTYDDLQLNDLRTIISFNILSNPKIKNGNVVEIKVPNDTIELSPIWIGHELVHALKDTNFNEYILKDISSETLPIFYEILVSHTIFKDMHDNWKENRLSFLENHKNIYKQLEDQSKIDEQYEITRYSYGQYLTSYYYALNLFHIYKENPKLVTKYINKVLNHKKTTLDLLNELDIYKINKEHVNIYKLEHSKL